MKTRKPKRTGIIGLVTAAVVFSAQSTSTAFVKKPHPAKTPKSPTQPFQLRIHTGSIGVMSKDKVSVRVAHVAGQRKVAIRVWFFDESGQRLNNAPVEVRLRPKHSSSFDLDVATLSGSGPKMVRAVVHAVGFCGKKDRSSSLIVQTEHRSGGRKQSEVFSVCPVVLCKDTNESNPPNIKIANECTVQYNE